MSLLNDFARSCVIMVPTRDADEAGGSNTTWAAGTAFVAYQALDTSIEARRAEKEGVTSTYSALVDKAVDISYGDVFRDESTGQTYRVTSDPADKIAPASSTMPLKYFTAERWELPT